MLRRSLVVLLIAVGCSPKGREVTLRFQGNPPPGAYALDTREVLEECPSCERPADRHATHPCGAAIRFRDRVTCGFCLGAKSCTLCAAFETAGLCRFCGGQGRRGAEICFGCAGTGACTACAGSATCDACGGNGSIALPWFRPAPRVVQRRAVKTPSFTPEENDSPLVWVGESVVLPRRPGEWTVFSVVNGHRAQVARVAPEGRFAPKQEGSYIALSGSHALFFDAVAVKVHPATREENGTTRHLSASADFSPPLSPGFEIGWEWVPRQGLVKGYRGNVFVLHGLGHYEAWPVIRTPGLPERRGPQPAVFCVSTLSIRPPSGVHLRARTSVAFQVAADPPLPENTVYEWTWKNVAIATHGSASTRSTLEIELPAVGKYSLQVRAAGNVSPPLEVSAYGLGLEGPGGLTLPEARLAILEGSATPSESWLAASPDRFRIVVEDPEPDAPGTLVVTTRSANGSPLQEGVEYALAAHGRVRATRPLVLLGDRSDSAVSLGGPEDPTLSAEPRGRVEVRYRGVTASVADVGPVVVRDVPVRIVMVGSGFPGREELVKILDRRLEEASAVWAPFGRRFRRSSLEVAGTPKGIVLLRGRSAGTDAQGKSSRLGIRADGVEALAPPAWKGPPVATARQLASRLEPAFRVEIFEKLLSSDREAVALRIRRPDGAAAGLEVMRDREDVSQSATLLGTSLTDGCEVSADRALLSLEELSILLGLRGRPSEGVDLFLVSRFRAGGEGGFLSKAYRSDDFSAPLAGSALAAWEIADGSENYPYGLARILGTLLLPSGWNPRPEDTLFDPVLSRLPAPDAHKRIGRATGARVREGGRGPGTENDDTYKGIEQGGK